MIEPFGVDYERPAEADCPNCHCCTARLCERGRQSVHQCRGLTHEDYRAVVYSCPCSSALTRGTHAWRLGRVRVTLYATEHPLPPVLEVALRALAQGEGVEDVQALARLRVAGLAQALADRTSVITEMGQFYLDMRSAPRFPTPVEVLGVDTKARTASCVVVGWHLTRPVTLLLDQLQADTKLSAEELPGTWLEAYANCRAAEPDDLVLTRITVAPEPPEGFMDAERTLELPAADRAPAGGEQA